MQYFMINYLYCKLRRSLLSQSLDMFLSDSVDLSCLIAKSIGQYNCQNDIFLANFIGLAVHALIYILLIFKFDLYRGACGGGRSLHAFY